MFDVKPPALVRETGSCNYCVGLLDDRSLKALLHMIESDAIRPDDKTQRSPPLPK